MTPCPANVVRHWLRGALLALLAAPAAAQAAAPAPAAPGGATQGAAPLPQLTQARPFTWAPTDDDRGLVRVPVGRGGGWLSVLDPGFQVRLVSSFSSDPTVEVLLYPSLSGVAGKAERFLLQFPLGALGGAPTPAVVAFHPFGVSEKSPFQGSVLPTLCQQRGWLLIAPYGLIDTNYAQVDAQTALLGALALVDQYLPIDRTRLYGVGFSMGALNALSFGMRHQDPDGFRFAGIVDHSGPLDAAQQYAIGDAALKALLADPDHFGGSPAAKPFEYERISPAPLLGGAIDPLRAAVENLLHVPIYLHCNMQDPDSSLVTQTLALHAYLEARGGKVQLSTTMNGSLHAWSTLDMAAALDFLEPHPLGALPTSMRMHADRPGRWLASTLLAAPGQSIARYRLDRIAGANAFQLRETRSLDALAVDLAALGLWPGQPLFLEAESADGSSDQLVLQGYGQPPASVKLFGFLPLPWTHDAGADTLQMTPHPTGTFVLVEVQP
ncbi:MAG: hypothetical protein FJ299_06175 [Planctomycetes bacterium]|nr:hypothetical protein [Planctomycetota bacterium]